MEAGRGLIVQINLRKRLSKEITELHRHFPGAGSTAPGSCTKTACATPEKHFKKPPKNIHEYTFCYVNLQQKVFRNSGCGLIK